MGINRNIVECKGTYVSIRQTPVFVLIGTLWNVKELKNRIQPRRRRINRNIVECKVEYYLNSAYSHG